MLRSLTPLLVRRVVGSGPLGFVASAAFGWMLEKAGERGEPQVLDTSDLRVGERYVVVVHPPRNRRQRKVAKQLRSTEASLHKERARRTGPAAIRTAKRIRRLQWRAELKGPTSRAATRADAKLGPLFDRLDMRTAPSRRQQALEERAATLRAQLKAAPPTVRPTRRRPTRRREFH
ncbi:MAG: hypothetical protein R2698_11650 [Microthrixaceae bacterium]